MKPIKAWIVKLPATNRPISKQIVFCPDGKENDWCLQYDVYERKAAAVHASLIYPEKHREVIQVLITPISDKSGKTSH